MINPIAALSPLDGRYAKSVEALRPIFSEYGLMRARVKVELSWLKALAAEPKITEIPAFSDFTLAEIDKVIENFSLEDAAAVKAIEATTNHDVKAIEYWLKERFAGVPEVAAASEFIHFACTSEDINNLSHALMLQEARETVILPKLAEIIEKLTGMAHDLAAVPMMSRTHGQPAPPPHRGAAGHPAPALQSRSRPRGTAVPLHRRLHPRERALQLQCGGVPLGRFS